MLFESWSVIPVFENEPTNIGSLSFAAALIMHHQPLVADEVGVAVLDLQIVHRLHAAGVCEAEHLGQVAVGRAQPVARLQPLHRRPARVLQPERMPARRGDDLFAAAFVLR